MNEKIARAEIYPESCYSYRSLTLEEVQNALQKNKTIVGYVKECLKDECIVTVDIGEGISAFIPFSEVTIYPLTYSSLNYDTPVQIHNILKKKVCVKVTEIIGDTVVLSRRKNMEEAYEYLKNCEYVRFHIKNMASKTAFGDMGQGITACIALREVSNSRVQNVSEVLAEDMSYIHDKTLWCKVIAKDDKNRFYLSYKQTFKPYNPDDYPVGTCVTGTVTSPVDAGHSGYFIRITPQVSGILDTSISTLPMLRYGDKIEAWIRKSSEKGLKLRFARIIQ